MNVNIHQNQQPPVTFTDAAVGHIENEFSKQPGSCVFRLSVKDSGCNGLKYVTDLLTQAPEGDIQYTVQQGVQISIDPAAIKVVSGTEVDYQIVENNLGMKRLVFKNPQVKGECGCGESFNVE